jgi:probable F420-dependent oxidoreductase
VSVRVGISFGTFPFSQPAAFWSWVDACEASTVDSIWISDRLVGPAFSLEPLSALAAIAGRTRRLKVGCNVVVLPAREPVLLAKQCATIDYLSDGRFLPAFGVGADQAPEWPAMGLSPQGRGARANEMLSLLDRLWTDTDVTFDGKHFNVKHASIRPRPKQAPLPMWIGGSSPAAIERTARYGHGWLGGSTASPAMVAPVVAAVKARAAELGRVIPDDHFGVGFSYRFGDWDEPIVAEAVRSLAARGSADPHSVMAVGTSEAIVELVRAFVAVGVSKFVLRPIAASGEEMLEQTVRLSREVIPIVHT